MILVENTSERQIIHYEHILPLRNCRTGSEVSRSLNKNLSQEDFFIFQLTCGKFNSVSNEIYLCNNEGEMILINMQSSMEIKSSNRISSSKITSMEFVQSTKRLNSNHQIKLNENKPIQKSVDSLFDYNSSDDELQDQLSFYNYAYESFDNSLNNEQDETIWLGTDQGG